MYQLARFPPVGIIAEERHLRRKNTGIVVGHDVLLVLVVFLLGLTVGAFCLVDVKIIVQFADVSTVVVGHHNKAVVCCQHIVKPLVVAAGKLHRIAFRPVVGWVTVDQGLRIIAGSDEFFKVLIFQYDIL